MVHAASIALLDDNLRVDACLKTRGFDAQDSDSREKAASLPGLFLVVQ